MWAVGEHDVLQGIHKVLNLVAPDEPPPAPVPTPEDPEAERLRIEQEKAKEKEDFQASLGNYVDARDEKLKAAKIYKKVDKAERPIIWSYAEKYGIETVEDRGDFLVEEFGQAVQLEKTPSGFDTQYEQDAMAAWLMKNGHSDCVKMVPVIDDWKKLKEAGKVPASIITTLETPVEYEATFKLTVRELKTDEKEEKDPEK
jgi:hypothetical protein